MRGNQLPEQEKKHMKRSLLVLFILLICFAAAIFAVETQIRRTEIRLKEDKSATGIRQTLEMFETSSKQVGSWFYRDLNAGVRIMTIALRDQVKDGIYTGPMLLEDGFIVHLVNGKPEMAAEAAARFSSLTAEMVRQEYTAFWIPDESAEENADGSAVSMLLTSGNITGDWYYIDWTDSRAYDEYFTSQIDISRIVDTIGEAYEGELFLISSSNQDGKILHSTPGLEGISSLADLGLTMEDLSRDSFEAQLPSQGRMLFFVVPMAELKMIAVYGRETADLAAQSVNRVITMTFIAAIALSVLFTWAVYLRGMAASQKLSPEQRTRYAPTRVRKTALRLGIVAAAVMLLAGFFVRSLQYTHHMNETASGMLDALSLQIGAETERASRTREQEIDWYVYFGDMLASLIQDDPSLMEREKLAEISTEIQADFIIIFDQNGKQLACSRDYINFVLPTDASESVSDFRRILKGVASIVHEPERNSVTGEIHQMIGVRFPIPDHTDLYGVLIIAVQENVIMQARLDDVRNRIYPQLVPTDEIVVEIDPETKTVVSSSRENWAGRAAENIGIPDSSLKENHMDFFRLDNGPWYGVSRTIDGHLFYLMQNQSGFFLIALIYGLIALCLFALVWWVMARTLFRGYTHEAFLSAQNAAGMPSAEADSARASKNPAVRWKQYLPEQKANFVFQLLLGLMMLYLLIASSGSGPLAQNAVLSFVFSGGWARAFNLFSVTACLVVVCLAVFCWVLMKFFFRLINSTVTPKGETLYRLTENILEYVIVIVSVFLILSCFGMDTGTLLASAGLLGMAVSLGAKDLMADILAGITIIFERDYQVGDIVSVNNFRGTVQEIGVRSMRIKSDDNNVMIINNHEIHNVINMSRYTSTFVVDFDVPLSTSAADLEALMTEQLPRIGKEIPEIIGEPVYRGITTIKHGAMTITVTAECRERDLYKVRRKMNRSMKAAFEQAGIQIS